MGKPNAHEVASEGLRQVFPIGREQAQTLASASRALADEGQRQRVDTPKVDDAKLSRHARLARTSHWASSVILVPPRSRDHLHSHFYDQFARVTAGEEHIDGLGGFFEPLDDGLAVF